MKVAAAFVLALVLVGCGHQSARPASEVVRPSGPRETCATRSMAGFPHAFTDRRNLVVGPLAIIGGGAFTTPQTVREFGGNKFPLLVRAGHRVTIELSQATRRTAALGYGPLPQGEVGLEDGHRVVTFVACRRSFDSGSDADGDPVTFWSGFLLAGRPQCVRLRVWVDRDGSPREGSVPLGRRC